tara:strand:- start:4928 stop:5113 length:186 start_codon:yes stop_codon:yes gene_type:complete
MATCSACNNKTKELHTDPRTPPLEEEPCLCRGCTLAAWEYVAEEHQENLLEARAEIKRLEA